LGFYWVGVGKSAAVQTPRVRTIRTVLEPEEISLSLGSSSRRQHEEETMKKLVLVLVLVAFAFPANADGEDQIVVGLVDKALEIFKAQGKDQALKVCATSAGPLRKGALYVFVMDFKGRFMAHPVQEDLRGQDAWELQDAKGKFITQEFIKIAKEKGQGWSEYWWLRINETAPTLKKTYIKRVPGEDLLVGCGHYVK
jgi:cytochrome c